MPALAGGGAFARDLIDFVSPDMTMAEYLHGINTLSDAWRDERVCGI